MKTTHQILLDKATEIKESLTDICLAHPSNTHLFLPSLTNIERLVHTLEKASIHFEMLGINLEHYHGENLSFYGRLFNDDDFAKVGGVKLSNPDGWAVDLIKIKEYVQELERQERDEITEADWERYWQFWNGIGSDLPNAPTGELIKPVRADDLAAIFQKEQNGYQLSSCATGSYSTAIDSTNSKIKPVEPIKPTYSAQYLPIVSRKDDENEPMDYFWLPKSIFQGIIEMLDKGHNVMLGALGMEGEILIPKHSATGWYSRQVDKIRLHWMKPPSTVGIQGYIAGIDPYEKTLDI